MTNDLLINLFSIWFKAGLSTPFHWLFYNVDLPARHRDRISSALNCDPVKLDAIHISPMRKPDFFWSNIPGLEAVLHPIPPLDRISLQVDSFKLRNILLFWFQERSSYFNPSQPVSHFYTVLSVNDLSERNFLEANGLYWIIHGTIYMNEDFCRW